MKDDNTSGASLSFLDVIACAFGAIVLLVLIIPIGEKGVPASQPDLAITLGKLLFNTEAVEKQISTIEHQINENQGIVERLSTDVASLEQKNQVLMQTIQSTISETQKIDGMTKIVTTATSTINQSTAAIEARKTVNTEYAGIPVDAEYVAFVIDTSGSMGMIRTQVKNIFSDLLDLYPDLKGIQILNDQGLYIERAKRWIPDSPSTRTRLRQKYLNWRASSDSNPAPGIETAISDLYEKDIRMAVFVLGDDYANSNFAEDFDDIDLSVKRNQVQEGSFRLHGVVFPNVDSRGSTFVFSALDYLIFMRTLTERYNGVLVGLEMEPTNFGYFNDFLESILRTSQ